MTTGKTGSIHLNKWHLAIIIGTPLVIGCGYAVYKKRSSNQKKSNCKKDIENFNEKSITIENSDIENKIKNDLQEKSSPLEIALLHKNEGNICFRNGKYDEAINYYDKAIENCPNDKTIDLSIFYQNRAAAYEMLKKWNQVKSDCTKSLEYNPRYSKAYFRRGKAYEQTKDFSQSLNDITATCLLEGFQNSNTILYADRLLKMVGSMDADKGMKNRIPCLPSKYFIRTYFRSFVNDPLRKIIVASTEPKGFIRAKMAMDAENYEDILPACLEEINMNDEDSQYKYENLLLRGTINLLYGFHDEAYIDFSTIINNDNLDPSFRAHALIKRASVHIQTQRKEDALKDFELSEKLDSNNSDLYHQRGQMYTVLEEMDKALIDYEKSVKLSPEHGIVYVQKCYADYRLAYLANDQMRLTSVMNDFKNAIEKYPNCVECYNLMAQVLTDQGQYEQAQLFFEKAIKMTPDNAPIYVHWGMMFLAWKGDVQKAINYLDKAIETDEKCVLAYETYGSLEIQRANLNKAVELFDTALKYVRTHTEMSHIYSLKNAAISQINVTKNLGIDLSTIAALTKSGVMASN